MKKTTYIWAITLVIVGLMIASVSSTSVSMMADENSMNETIYTTGIERGLVAESFAINQRITVKTLSSRNPLPLGIGEDIQLSGFETNDISPSLASNGVGGVMMAMDMADPSDEFNTIAGFKYSSDNGETWPSDEETIFFDFGGDNPDIDYPDVDGYGGTGAFGTCVPVSDTYQWTMDFPDISDPSADGGWSAMTWLTDDPVHYAVGAGVNEEYAPFTEWSKGLLLSCVDEPGRDYDWSLRWQSSDTQISGIHYPTEQAFDNGRMAIDIDLDTGKLYNAIEYSDKAGVDDGFYVEYITMDGGNPDWWQGSWGTRWIATNGTAYPDVSTNNNGSCYVVYVHDGDIKCFYTNNNALTWSTSSVTETEDSEQFPQVTVDDDKNPVVLFTLDGDLFVVTSDDAGATWGTPEQVNDEDGTVVEEYKCVDADSPVGAWQDDRNGNTDIYLDFIGEPANPPVVTIEDVAGGLGLVKAAIKNAASAGDATDVHWSITVTGGILGRIDVTTEDTIASLAAGASEDIQTDEFIFGLGSVDITIEATFADTWTGTGFVLGPFVIGVKSG